MFMRTLLLVPALLAVAIFAAACNSATGSGFNTNQPPTAIDDSATTPGNQSVSITVTTNDTDPDGGVLTVTATGTPGNGSASIISGTTVQYTPNGGFQGVDAFSYTISDGSATATATVTITVTAPNNPPVAVNDIATTDQRTPIDINLTANDSDADADPLMVQSVSTPAGGSVTIISSSTVRFTPSGSVTGLDSFSYTLSDGTDTDSATVTVSIAPVWESRSTTVFDAWQKPQQIVMADLNGDQRPDLATSSAVSPARAGVFFNQTTQGASAPTLDRRVDAWTQDGIPYGIAVADFNADGLMDLVTANALSASVSVLLQNAGAPGTFLDPQNFTSSANLNGIAFPTGVCVGDFDRDGTIDIAVAHAVEHTVSVLINLTQPDSPVAVFTTIEIPVGGFSPRGIVTIDINNDGAPDLAWANSEVSGAAGVSAFLNESTPGSLQLSDEFTFDTTGETFHLDAGDVNQDGRPDLVTIDRGPNGSAGQISVLLNTTADRAATPTFADRQTLSIGSASQGDITVRDLNGDGRPDIAAVNYSGAQGMVSVFLSTTDAGANTVSFEAPVNVNVVGTPMGLDSGDMNGDGIGDLACSHDDNGDQTMTVIFGR